MVAVGGGACSGGKVRGVGNRQHGAAAGGQSGVAVCGCHGVWLCVAVCGCVWLCVAVCGRVWLCVAVCGSVRCVVCGVWCVVAVVVVVVALLLLVVVVVVV